MSDEPVSLTPPQGYAEWLAELKARIHVAQQRATLAVNRELVLLYWNIGRDVLARQAEQGWGAKVVDRLAKDLRGRICASGACTIAVVPPIGAAGQAAEPKSAPMVCRQAIEHNWSRNVLAMQIETQLLERTGQAVTNFPATLPAPQSDLARESIKDPYRFDFLGLT